MEVLSGRVNPSGKLPVSFPVSAAVLPVYYNHKPSSRRSGRCDVSNGVLWPFGHGLSYTSFAYSNLSVPATVAPDGEAPSLYPPPCHQPAVKARICSTVTNTGNVTGTEAPPLACQPPLPSARCGEVAQLYIRDLVASVTTPVKMLKDPSTPTLPSSSPHRDRLPQGFQRVELRPGEASPATPPSVPSADPVRVVRPSGPASPWTWRRSSGF